MKRIRLRRLLAKVLLIILRLIYTAFLLLLGIVIVNFTLAWIFVRGLTHPGCQIPDPVAGVPKLEEHWLETEDGVAIRIWYIPSRNGAAVISLGGPAGELQVQIPPIDFLLEAGYGIVLVDTRACATPPVPVTLGGDEIYDGEAAMAFLKGRNEIAVNRIGVMGFSMGGATAFRLAAQHPEIRAVVRDGGFTNLGVLLAPSGDSSIPQNLFRTATFVFYRQQTGIVPWTVSPIDNLPSISPRPVLLIYGEEEAFSGREQYQVPGENKILWIVPGGKHGQNHLIAPQEYRHRVLAFFDQALLGVSPP